MARLGRHAAASVAALLALAACRRDPEPRGFTALELVHRLNGRQEHETVVYGRDAMKVVTAEATVILRYADRTVFAVDDARRTLHETSLDAFLEQRKEKERAPDLPELPPSAVKIEATGRASEFGGLRAKLTLVSAPGIHVELWLTDEITPPGPRHATFELLEAMGGPLAIPAALFDHLEGFPVRSMVRVQGDLLGQLQVTRALLSVERVEPAPQALAPPAGYVDLDAAGPSPR